MTDYRFDNKGGGDQNIAQGDRSIGKQENRQQASHGDHNIFSQTGDVHVEHHHYPTAGAKPSSILPGEDDIFLHREAELTWLDQHLSPDKVVAVCGPGGMGKSALAARAVRSLPPDRFPDGIIFHTFYHQAETAKALQTIARALHLPIEGNLEQEVAAALGSRQALLVLDGAEEADDLDAVLRLRGRCGVLITTRKKSDCGPLRWDLQALPDEEAEEVLRAWGGDAGDQEAIEQIAKLLGGWPVALRLAGRYLHSTGEPATDYLRWLQEEPFKELGDSEEHQRDNAALLLRRSTAQVGEDARLVLGLAGCLVFDLLATAPMIALLEGDERQCRKVVNELVNYGLLERRGERLHIGHALVHTYAHTELALNRESLKRLTEHYIVFCYEQSQAGLEGYARLDGERMHCQRLIETCLDSELWEDVKLLVWAINTYLDRQGWWTEKLAAIEMRLTAARQAGDQKDEAWSLNELGVTCQRRGELEQARVWYEQCLLINRELGDRQGEGVILTNIANIYQQQGKYGQALEQYQQGLNIRQEVGDQEGEGATLNSIGSLYNAQGDIKKALQYFEQCLPLRQESGDKIGEGVTLNNIANIYYTQGDYRNAVEQHKKALAIRRELGDRAGEAESCWNTGLTYGDMGDLAQAEEHIGQAVEIAEQIGHAALDQFRDGLEQVRGARPSSHRKGMSALWDWLRGKRRGA